MNAGSARLLGGVSSAASAVIQCGLLARRLGVAGACSGVPGGGRAWPRPQLCHALQQIALRNLSLALVRIRAGAISNARTYRDQLTTPPVQSWLLNRDS